jgi:hypothetical protein
MPQGLELEEDLQFQRRWWLAERIGWAIMIIFLLGGLAGMFGTGPISNMTAGSPETFWLEYERFARYESPTSLRITLKTDSPATSPHVKFNRAYMDSVKIEQIVPEPAKVEASRDSIAYYFEAHPCRVRVKFDVVILTIGVLPGSVASPGGGLSFRQFVYP